MPSRHDANVVLLSVLLAWFAAYVALNLVARLRSHRGSIALAWGFGASIALGTGIWSMHFVGMLGWRLPIEVGYALAPTAASWLAAVGVSMVALAIASRPQRSALHIAAGALVMGAGICAMHYIGMAALRFAPGLLWDVRTVALSAAVAVAASALALWLFGRLQHVAGDRSHAVRMAAGAVMAIGISGMHYTGMAAATVPEGALCLSAGELHGDSLSLMAATAALLLLGLALLTSLVDERMQGTERALRRALLHDPLTGLPNRALFDERLRRALETCRHEPGHRVALLVIGLDGFKSLNDQFGQGFGNAVLQQVAQRIAALAGEHDTVARLSGDVFAWLIDAAPGAAAAAGAAEQVLAALQDAVHRDEQEATTTASIGFAPGGADSLPDRLLSSADTAMFEAKRLGGARALLFSERMEAETFEQLALRQDLRLALDAPASGQLTLHYQPKVRSSDSHVTGVEALLRWQHPTRGTVGPAVFIAVAERFGLMDRLGRWVIEEACRQMAAWQREGLAMRVAVNLSIHQLRNPDLVPHIAATLRANGLSADRLLFEITESTAMTDIDASLAVFDALGALGASLSIDDFGTGYSSLAYLQRLPVKQLKIDRSFVRDLATSGDARTIVEAVVRMAHALGVSVVAEGVETESQRLALRAVGCDELQGWLFARPVPAAVLADWAHGRGRPAALHFEAADSQADSATTIAFAA